MDIDCIKQQGSIGILTEIIRDFSSGVNIYICTNCNIRAFVNRKKDIYECTNCLKPNIVKVYGSKTNETLHKTLLASGVKITYVNQSFERFL